MHEEPAVCALYSIGSVARVRTWKQPPPSSVIFFPNLSALLSRSVVLHVCSKYPPSPQQMYP